MKRVLVGTDGSASGEVAVRWAVELATATGSQLLVAYVWLPSFADVSPEIHDGLRDDASQTLEGEWCAPARDAGIAVEAVLLEGDPRKALLHTADERDVDLVVVGAPGHAYHPHALHLGSVTHHLVHHTDRPLAVIPASAPPVPPTRILVGVDGSDGSIRAVDWCRDVAGAFHAEVLAVHGRASGAGPAASGDLPADTLVVEQEPVAALTETGVRERAELLVVGSRGHGGFAGLRLGSTALKLLHHSGLPVVLVPAPDD